VNDGSTDATASIVGRYLAKYLWIELVNLPVRKDRNFAAKVYAFNAGQEKVKDLGYEVIGNLDADVSLDEDHFEFLLGKLLEDNRLGVTGTVFAEEGYSSETDSFEGQNHVSGQCQLFRRECFEQIGGYRQLKNGGVDLVAVLTARMNGWTTRTFTEKSFVHHRRMGTADNSIAKARFEHGRTDYVLGSHPLWALCRSIFQMSRRPFIVGGCSLLAGFIWAMTHEEIQVTDEILKFRRQEQMQKLKSLIKGWMWNRGVRVGV